MIFECLAVVVMVLMVEDTLGFVRPTFHAMQGCALETASSSTSPFCKKQTCLSMLDQLPHAVGALTSVETILSHLFESPPYEDLTAAASNLVDPIVEAELLTDVAHIALDCTTFLGPDTIAIRLVVILGRIFAIGADYLPDHKIFPEEVIFQAVMLAISSIGFIESTLLTLRARSANTTIRDGRVYIKTFSRAGTTWKQYKTMSAISALEWMEVESGKIILSGEANHDYFYFLYDGAVTVQHSQGQDLGNYFKHHLVGEMNFVCHLDGLESDEELPKTTIKAGDEGATLLRIHSSKLIKLMKNDHNLAKSIRSWIIMDMQQKLSTAMRTNMALV
jgi:hypothetical protein